MIFASVAIVVFTHSQMQKSDQDNILSLALHMLPADLLVDTAMYLFKKKMLAVGSVMRVEQQPEMSRRFTNAAPHPPPDLARADEPGRTEHSPAGSAAQDKSSYL